MKKALIGLCTAIILIALIATGTTYVRQWAHTEHGKIDYKAAIGLKLFESFMDPGLSGEMTPQKYRDHFDRLMINIQGPPIEVGDVQDKNIPGPAGDIPVRIYTPKGDEKFPVILYFHGGGFVIGKIETHDNLTRYLTNKASSIVVSVDYRLAPEHTFPAAVEDAYAALQWVSQNAEMLGGDAAKIAVAGDSAGGNLAAVVTLMSRDKKGPLIRYQALIYPVTNLSVMNTDSHQSFEKNFFLTKELIQWFRTNYLPDQNDWTNPYASPLLAEDHSNLPPGILITAQFDPLRDEGETYGKKLKEAGVEIKITRYDGMLHGFVSNYAFLGQAFAALDEIAAGFEQAL